MGLLGRRAVHRAAPPATIKCRATALSIGLRHREGGYGFSKDSDNPGRCGSVESAADGGVHAPEHP